MAQKVAKLEVDEEEVKRKKKLMEEIELRKLTREEILMRNVSEKKDALTEKQKTVISALTKENSNLMSNLRVMQTERRCTLDSKQAQDISELFGQGDSLDLEIAREKQYIADLETQIRKESTKLLNQQRTAKGVDAVTDYGLHMENQRKGRLMEALQSRLHAEQVHLSTVTKENEELRLKISLQLKTKARFNELFEEIIQKLNRGKTMMKGIAEKTQATFKKRDEFSRKIQALKERDAADLAKRQEEMQDLKMRLDDDRVTLAYKTRVLMARAKLSETKRATKKQNQTRKALERQLRELIDTLTTVKFNSGMEEVSDICKLLTTQEAENFSLFNYNNEVRYQLESLTEQTVELMRKVDDEQEMLFQWQNDQQRNNHLLESALARLEIEHSDLSDTINANNRTFDRLLAKIQAVFSMAKCDRWPLNQLLGENETVTEFNYRLYLDLVETRLVELISSYTRGRVDATTLTSKLSTFSTSRDRTKSADRTATAFPDRKMVTTFCLECSMGDSKFRANFLPTATSYM